MKVGIGPGGGCTTRITTSFGVPQLQALVTCRVGVGDGVPMIADGGIKRHGGAVRGAAHGRGHGHARQRVCGHAGVAR